MALEHVQSWHALCGTNVLSKRNTPPCNKGSCKHSTAWLLLTGAAPAPPPFLWARGPRPMQHADPLLLPTGRLQERVKRRQLNALQL